MSANLVSIKNSKGDFITLMTDPQNLHKCRNTNNTSEFEYNCMAYAFNTYNWIIPIIVDCFFEDSYDNMCEYDEDGNMIEEPEIFYSEDEIYHAKEELYKQILDLGGDDEDFEDIYYDCHLSNEIAIKIVINNLLNTFKGLRQIESLSEVKDDEYGIIYAAGRSDFHFCKYDPITKSFFHKQGHCDVDEVESYEDAFDERYDSEKIFFAMKGTIE